MASFDLIELTPCAECGMPCTPQEYHPFAACLMFKGCHNSATVRANLPALLAAAEGVERDAGIGAAVTPDDATIAIESMDAYARKGGITAYGPVGVLRQFVSQYRAMQAELEEAQEMVRSTYGEAAPMRDSGEGRE